MHKNDMLESDQQLIKPIIKMDEKELIRPIQKGGTEKKLIRPIIKHEKREGDQAFSNSAWGNSLPLAGRISESQIYLPQITENVNYTKPKDNLTPQELADRIKEWVRFGVYHEGLYYFRREVQTYQKLAKLESMQLIDRVLVGMKLRPSTSSVYREVLSCILFDSTIAIADDFSLDMVWAFRNTLLDIRNMQTILNRGEYFVRDTLQCEYNPAATCPNFDLFLCAVSGNDPLIIELIWEVCGYILSPDMSAKNFFTFLGAKDTGKTLLANIVASFFSADQISALDISDFGQRFALSELEDKHLNLSMDLTDEAIPGSAVGKIKSGTGNDFIRAEKKYKEGKAFHNRAKLLFGSNHPLRTAKPDVAFYDRQIVIPFLYPVPEEKQDKNLAAKLMEELPGIANKAIEAYKRLRQNNYVFPQPPRRLPDSLVYDDEKIIRDFGVECLDFTDHTAKTHTQDLYSEYEKYCIAKGVEILEDAKEFSAVFNRIYGSQAERKKINIDGKILQGYLGVRIIPGRER